MEFLKSWTISMFAVDCRGRFRISAECILFKRPRKCVYTRDELGIRSSFPLVFLGELLAAFWLSIGEVEE